MPSLLYRKFSGSINWGCTPEGHTFQGIDTVDVKSLQTPIKMGGSCDVKNKLIINYHHHHHNFSL